MTTFQPEQGRKSTNWAPCIRYLTDFSLTSSPLEQCQPSDSNRTIQVSCLLNLPHRKRGPDSGYPLSQVPLYRKELQTSTFLSPMPILESQTLPSDQVFIYHYNLSPSYIAFPAQQGSDTGHVLTYTRKSDGYINHPASQRSSDFNAHSSSSSPINNLPNFYQYKSNGRFTNRYSSLLMYAFLTNHPSWSSQTYWRTHPVVPIRYTHYTKGRNTPNPDQWNIYVMKNSAAITDTT